MHRQWTSKIGVFHSWTDRLKKGGFWGFHGQKMVDFPKNFDFFLKSVIFFGNYRQKNNRTILGSIKMVETNIYFGRNSHPFSYFIDANSKIFSQKSDLNLICPYIFF